MGHTVIDEGVRSEPTLHVEGADRSWYLLVQRQLALASIDAFDLLLDPSSQHVFLGAGLLVVGDAALALVLDDPVLPLEHLIALLLHLLDPEQELLPKALVILLQDCVLPL